MNNVIMTERDGLNSGRYIIGSYTYKEQQDEFTAWGWEYSFKFNNPLSIQQMDELVKVITDHLNNKVQ